MRINLVDAHDFCYGAFVARLNISIPDDLYKLANRWRGSMNLSQICARALREELEASEDHRSPGTLLDSFERRSGLEQAVVDRYSALEEVVAREVPSNGGSIRETLGKAAARYLDRNLCDGAVLGVAGGRQMWCMVRNLSPRRIRVRLAALGFQLNDPRILHAHPNTLITLLWIMYSPRSEAHLVGGDGTNDSWFQKALQDENAKYFVVSSCSEFDPQGPFAGLIGKENTNALTGKNVYGDFAYQFVNQQGSIVDAPLSGIRTVVPAETLQGLSRRRDGRVILVAGGTEKERLIRFVVRAGLCNVLITDDATAKLLLQDDEVS